MAFRYLFYNRRLSYFDSVNNSNQIMYLNKMEFNVQINIFKSAGNAGNYYKGI